MDRNEPIDGEAACPCGSGSKFKDCCREFFEAYASFRGRDRRLGKIRPMLNLDVNGDKLIAVGGRVYALRTWKTVPDFLRDYIKHQFGRTWWLTECRRPQEDEHPVIELARTSQEHLVRSRAGLRDGDWRRTLRTALRWPSSPCRTISTSSATMPSCGSRS